MAAAKRQVDFRLVHDGEQPGTPLDEPLQFGLQDAKGEIHPGKTHPGQLLAFDFVLEAAGGNDPDQPVFRGAFAHGPPAKRFIYLSWKRHGEREHPWGWRIKIPLSGIGWAQIHRAESPGKCLETNVVGRRPHSSETVDWKVKLLNTG